MSDQIIFKIINARPEIRLTANGQPIFKFIVRGLVPVPGNGGGDMLKADYDTDFDGKVDEALNSDNLGNIAANLYALKTDIGAEVLTFVAGSNLSSGRAVIKDIGKVYYFDPTNIIHAGRVIGITKTSGIANGNVDVQTSGIMTDAAFSFTVDRAVYVEADGSLTTTVPTTRIIQKVGVSLLNNKLSITFNSPLIKLP